MSKGCIKKICAAICAVSIAAQLAVMPVNAAYINEDKSNYLGDFAELEPVKLVTEEIGLEGNTSFGLDMGGNFTVSMDAVFSGSFPQGSTEKGVANSTYFYMGGSGNGKVGSHLMVDAVNDTGFKMHIKSDRINATTSSYLSYDKKYNIKFRFSNVASGGTPAYASVIVEIYSYDDKGNISASPIESLSGGLRNFSDGNGGSNKMPAIDVRVFTTEGVTSSVELSNVQRYVEVANEIDVKLSGKTLKDTETTEITLPVTATAVLPLESTVKSGGAAATAYTAVNSIAMADGSVLPEYIKYSDGKIIADVLLPGGEAPGEVKKYDLIVKSNISGYTDAKVQTLVTLVKGYSTPKDVVENYSVSVKDTNGNDITNITDISDNLVLDKGNARVSVEWDSSNDDVINSATGVVMPLPEDEQVTLTATITSPEVEKTYFQEELDAMSAEDKAAALKEIDEGTAVLGKILKYTYNVKGVKAIVDAAIASLKIVSNDDSTKVMDFVQSVNEDFVLPLTYADNESIVIEWTTDDKSNVTISKKGVAELVQKTLTPVVATVKAVVSYVKNDETLYYDEVEKEFTIDMTQEGTADKYIVRCDAAAGANFNSCPEDEEKITETKLDLPKEGIFGSDITWSSSVPSAISNTGKVTKQKTSKKVTLTAVISKGAAPSEIYTIKNLVVPATSGSTGGSGSGSGSSSSTNSTVSSTNNKASDVSYKGTLTPNTSLQKGDITTAVVSSFSDLNDAAWAKEAVTNLFNKGIINGKTASSFAPNDEITRAEFAKIVVKAFGLEDTSANVSEFSDVKAGDWYYTAVASAYNKGIIKGYANGTFGVNDKITRQDMAVIIYRAAQAANKTIAPVKDGVTFDDSADIASYASEAVSALQKGGVINGMTATTFAPNATATRAQAAQMIYGIVK